MADHLRTALVVGALDMASKRRDPDGTVHHSDQGCHDRGCQYTAIAFGQRCKEAGVRPSVGSVGDCYDNAMCESFTTGTSAQGARRFATLACELIERESFSNRSDARLAGFDYVEGFYNPRRLHSALDYRAPVNYKQEYVTRQPESERTQSLVAA